MSKLYAIFCLIIGIFSILYAGSAQGQGTNSSAQAQAVTGSTVIGTDFLVGVVPSANASFANITVIINTRVSTNATIFTNLTGNMTFPTFAKVLVVVLPGSLIPTLNGTSNTGIRITTSDPSSVQVIVNSTQIPNLNEGSLVFPVGTLGTRYFINGPLQRGAFTVLAANNATNVTLQFVNGTSFNFTLDAQQALSFAGPNLLGTIVQANSSVAVFSGRGTVTGPATVCNSTLNCSYLLEQLPRQENFGQNFVFVNPTGGLGQNFTNATLRLVTSSFTPVTVNISGLQPFNLSQNQSIAISAGNISNSISASGPIDVEVLAGSLDLNNRSLYGLIPNGQFVDTAFFFVLDNTTSSLTLVALTSDISNSSNTLNFTLSDGQPLNLNLTFQPSANSSYSYAFANLPSGAGPIVMDASFGVAGYLFESLANTTNYGSILGRNL